MSATGCAALHIPPGSELDNMLGLIRIGLKFRAQQRQGRRPDAITFYLSALVGQMHSPTFENLIDRLEIEVSRHDTSASECICTSVNRVWQTAEFLHPRRGIVDIPFSTLRNKLTKAKQSLK